MLVSIPCIKLNEARETVRLTSSTTCNACVQGAGRDSWFVICFRVLHACFSSWFVICFRVLHACFSLFHFLFNSASEVQMPDMRDSVFVRLNRLFIIVNCFLFALCLFYIQSSESSDSAESSNKIRIRQDSFRIRKFANFQFGSEIRMQH